MKSNKTNDERREFRRLELPKGQACAELAVGGLVSNRAFVRDISLGGVRLEVPARVFDSTGAGACVVRFTDRSKKILPATARGRIRRTTEHDGRRYVAIEFAQPLEFIGALAY